MGSAASKRAYAALRESPRFQTAVESSFEECVAVSQQKAEGVFLYQLNDASRRIYDVVSSPVEQPEEDPAFLLQQRWLPSPPAQEDVDLTLRRGQWTLPGKHFLTLTEFRDFACSLFRDMAIASAEHQIALYVPVGSIAMLAVHLSARKLPFYRSAGLLAPCILGSVLTAALALGFKFP